MPNETPSAAPTENPDGECVKCGSPRCLHWLVISTFTGWLPVAVCDTCVFKSIAGADFEELVRRGEEAERAREERRG